MRTLAIAVFLLLALPSAAQSSHRFLDRTNLLLHGANITAQGLDFYSTEQAINRPGIREVNPFGQSRRGRIVLKSVGIAAPVGLSYLLHRAGLHKAERIMPIVFAVPSGIAAGLNLRF